MAVNVPLRLITEEHILKAYPNLESEDTREEFHYAAASLQERQLPWWTWCVLCRLGTITHDKEE